MAVSEQTPYIEYIANGVTTSFPLVFDCDEQGKLIVNVDEVVPIVGTWELIGNSVVFLVPPIDGSIISIQRNTPLERSTNYQSYDNSFRPKPVNKDLDLIWWKLQELGMADWLLSKKLDKEIQDRILSDITYDNIAKLRENELKEYFEALINNITGGTLLPIRDNFVITEDGSTQRELNNWLKKHTLYENYLWQGSLTCWLMGYALSVDTTQRKQIPVGVTHARTGFADGTTIFHVNGTYEQDAMRIQRNATTSSLANHTTVINLSFDEAKHLFGNTCCLAWHFFKGDGYAASSFNVKIIGSEELEQPILRDDGLYSNGNQIIKEQNFNIQDRDKEDPYSLVFDLPSNFTQIAIVFTFKFINAVAIADDYIELEGIQLTPSDRYVRTFKLQKYDVLGKAMSRYQTTYPYGSPRGVQTEQGTPQMIAINTNANWAFAQTIKFNPPMMMPPQFLFQSPTSGTESRLLNKDTGINVNGIAFNLSESGVSITNNAVVVAGHRFLCHWTAQIIF